MKKSRAIAAFLLGAFVCISALPLVAAPVAELEHDQQTRFHIIENGEEHCSQWLIRSLSDSEEVSNRQAAEDSRLIDFTSSTAVSTLSMVRYCQVRDHHSLKLPRKRIYLANSVLQI